MNNSLLKSKRGLDALQWLGTLLLVIGFAGPWYYGPLGKTSDFGWQPIWGFLTGLLYINGFLLLSIVNCFCYAEFTIRRNRPVLEGILKWMGFFFLLLIIVPLVVWLLFDQTQRSHTPQTTINSLGWGVWVSLAGLIVQVIALRLQIFRITHQAKS